MSIKFFGTKNLNSEGEKFLIVYTGYVVDITYILNFHLNIFLINNNLMFNNFKLYK